MIAAARRLAGSPRGRAALAVAAVPAAALLALSPGALSASAARAALAAAVVGAAAALARRRGRAASPPQLWVVARQALAGDAGVALVEAGGRRLLVGYARGGVSLVAELGAPAEARP
ncbi:MAG TPA: flagellar biosynthetic protein FliO [Anaeromyxobacter sp.]|nr:flagellar biosynthetic protein FliO [Anaeromyxobacter sp.]